MVAGESWQALRPCGGAVAGNWVGQGAVRGKRQVGREQEGLLKLLCSEMAGDEGWEERG